MKRKSIALLMVATLLVGCNSAKESEKNFEMSINEHIEHFLAQGYTKKDAIKAVAKERGVHKNEIYKYILENA